MGLLSPIFDPEWRERLAERSRIAVTPERWRAFVTRFVDEHPQANFCFPDSNWIH
jgi:hypothetical protein